MAKTKRETNRGFSLSDTTGSTLVSSLTTNPETDIFSQLIEGGKFGTNKELNFRLLCNLTTGGVSLPTLTFKLKLGSSSLTLLSATALALSQTNKPFIIEGCIAAKDGQSAQRVWGQITQDGNNAPMVLNGGAITLASAAWTEDTSVDKTMSVSAQFAGLSSGATLQLLQGSFDMS